MLSLTNDSFRKHGSAYNWWANMFWLILISLSLFMTYYVMGPVFDRAWAEGQTA